MNYSDQKIDYPWLRFTIKANQYAISSRCVASISICPDDVIPLPESAAQIKGIFNLRGQIIPLIDMRILLGLPSQQEEFQVFADMLDARKAEHLHWVEELSRSSHTGEPFTLATDPHKCIFGRWYDHFESEQNTINFHLKKIREPHDKLHNTALEIQACNQYQDPEVRSAAIDEIFQNLREIYVPEILSLLDETKEIFRSSYREMVIILDTPTQPFGLLVDEVLAVESLELQEFGDNINEMGKNGFLYGLGKNKQTPEKNILIVDDSALFSTIAQIAAI